MCDHSTFGVLPQFVCRPMANHLPSHTVTYVTIVELRKILSSRIESVNVCLTSARFAVVYHVSVYVECGALTWMDIKVKRVRYFYTAQRTQCKILVH